MAETKPAGFPSEWLDALSRGGVELRVSPALPIRHLTNGAGEELPPQHWFPMYDYVYVSQELFDWLKGSLPRG